MSRLTPGADAWEVFKVRGKVFMLMTEVPGRPVVILKADPGVALAVWEQNSHSTAGHHMNKKHWITLEGGEGVGKELVMELGRLRPDPLPGTEPSILRDAHGEPCFEGPAGTYAPSTWRRTPGFHSTYSASAAPR